MLVGRVLMLWKITRMSVFWSSVSGGSVYPALIICVGVMGAGGCWFGGFVKYGWSGGMFVSPRGMCIVSSLALGVGIRCLC